jgi:hypothetical protein
MKYFNKNILKSKSMIYGMLATFFSVMVIAFTFLSKHEKDVETQNAEKQLKSSVEDVSINLSESLKKTTEVINNINTLGDGLNVVKADLKGQVELLKNSLDEAKRFQKLVDEQNKRDGKRFELEAANIVLYSSNAEFIPSVKDSSQYIFRRRFLNVGKRNGTVLSKKYLLLQIRDNTILDVLKDENNNNVEVIGKQNNPGSYYDVLSRKNFGKKFLENTTDKMIYIVKYIYQDEALKTNIEEIKIFLWDTYEHSKFVFSELPGKARPEFIKIFNEKFKE